MCVETSYEGTEVRGEVTQYAATDGFRRYLIVDGRGVEMGESDWESSSERHVRVSDDLGSIDAGSSNEGFGCSGRSGVTVVVGSMSADPYSERHCF